MLFASWSKVREYASDSTWRSERPESHEVIRGILERRGSLNPLLEAPWVKTSIFKMDWLHAADQGISADFAGNLLYYFEDMFPGTCRDDRCTAMMGMIQEYYELDNVQDRLDSLKPGLYTKSTGMKLKCSAAKCRKLIPFLAKLTDELCDQTDPVENAMHKAAYHLNQIYATLSSSADNSGMKDHSIKFAAQYVALHDHFYPTDDRLFRLKPKMHLFLHLCSDGGEPAKSWCYRDEDFGGSVGKAARRRGGLLMPASTSQKIIVAMNIGTPHLQIK